ncbi:MAG: pyrroloquinoline quinone-dependent dehydrogenase [Myxococcota bacterium]
MDYDGPTADWPEYGGDSGGSRWSPLTQIDRANVEDLELAWVYHHGDISDGSDGTTRTAFNATPIVVDDRLFFCTGTNRVIALDPASGTELWTFDPANRVTKLKGPYPRSCRGVAYAVVEPEAPPGTRCARRIFTGTVDSELIAIDAESGKLCHDFGEQGRVALREGVGDAAPWEYYVTSPPIVVGEVVVVGALVADNERSDAPSGVVRAFDIESGRLRWAFDPVPPSKTGSRRRARARRDYTQGTPNVWSILSADRERGLVFVPTGNPSPDYWAAGRDGLDYYGSSTIALDAKTGRVVWAFQTVHHDVWDYDVAAQPTLIDFPGPDGPVPAVIQATKMGHVFLLDRETGEPLFAVEERPVPQKGAPGEMLSPTQPFPTHIPPLHPQRLDPEDAWGFTPWDRARCKETLARYRSDGIFTPATLEGTIQYPGSAGGANWGGVSVDRDAGVFFVNQLRMPAVVTLIPRAEYEAMDRDAVVYPSELYPMEGAPYALRREPILSPLGAPCNPPPWGTLTAVDLASGAVLWESTLGTTRDVAPFPVWLPLGAPNLGGSVATAGGLVFIGATTDKFLRAFDSRTGSLVWSHRLPFTANATPLTYRLGRDAKQYVVVASGGHGWSEPGDALMAFALP